MKQSIALVTGATEGIGRATAFALGSAGYAVGVAARTPAKVADLLEELEAAGIKATGLPTDVSKPEAVTALVDHVNERLGEVDLLVNNAGIAIFKSFSEMTLDEWDRTFSVNVRSLYLMTRAVLPAMRARGHGDIVNVASLAGKNGIAKAVAYSASKHAVLGFSRSLLQEVRREGVRVIAVCPGSVDTPLMRDQDSMKPDFERILKPVDVAAAIVDLLSLPRRATVSELDIRPSNP